MSKTLISASLIIGFILLIPVKGAACPIPVFRYALEYWDADPYILEIIYKNSLTPEEDEIVNYLVRASFDSETKANLEVTKTDSDRNIGNILAGHLKEQSASEFPLMVLRYPRISGINEIIWSGHLNKENVNLLLNSPVRENISGKLAGNATAVWLLLESGDRRKDRTALEILEKELNRLEQTLVLPDPELWWRNAQDAEDKIPTINFEIVRVSRSDLHEEPLVKMLLNTEKDLKEFESEPIVFPLYGRGIALYAIVGKGINEWNIREAAEFLTGPCSCQAKLLNPGVDLLISMDWDGHVENLTDISIANPLSGIGDFSSREEEARRLLESATIKRLGSESGKGETPAAGSEKVVYLDIFADSRQKIESEIKDTPETGDSKKAMALAAESPDNKVQAEEVREKQEIYINDDLSEKGRSVTTIDNYQKPAGLNYLAVIFGGVILVVLLGGTLLFWKTSK